MGADGAHGGVGVARKEGGKLVVEGDVEEVVGGSGAGSPHGEKAVAGDGGGGTGEGGVGDDLGGVGPGVGGGDFPKIVVAVGAVVGGIEPDGAGCAGKGNGVVADELP